MPKKVLFIILDGIADVSEKTPLQQAIKPSLDLLAKNGIAGLIENRISENPDSGVSTFSLLGYPKEDYPGRGYLEALGMGLNTTPGSVYIRANFASVKESRVGDKRILVVVDRRGGRDKSGLYDMAKDIRELFLDGVRVSFYKSLAHRGVVVINSVETSPMVSDSDPLQEGKEVLEIRPLSNDNAAMKTATALNKFSEEVYRILKNHPQNKYRELPANYILLRGASSYRNVKSFRESYGLNAACVAATPILKGVARSMEIQVVDISGATADLKTDLREKTIKALDLLRKYNFVILHVKGCDVASHNKDPNSKRLYIEKIDREVVRRILEYAELDRLLLVIASDHPTNSKTGMHAPGLMPFVIFSRGIAPNKVERFDEQSCKEGPTINIENFIEEIMKFT